MSEQNEINKVKIINKPVYALIFEDFFGEQINKEILDEFISLKDQFKDAVIGDVCKVDKNIRDNKVCYPDVIFLDKRNTSKLLSNLDKKFKDDVTFRETLATAHYPVNEFLLTNYNETQISRYGGSEQLYEWHVDRYTNPIRTISLVYYIFKKPKRFEGGQLQFTDSPLVSSRMVDKDAEILTIEPKNDMAIVFSSMVAHRVLPTNSPDAFEDGRFSVNCWIGVDEAKKINEHFAKMAACLKD